MYGKHTNICTVVISGSLIVDQLEKVFVPENTDPPIIRLVPLKLVVIPNLQKNVSLILQNIFYTDIPYKSEFLIFRLTSRNQTLDFMI